MRTATARATITLQTLGLHPDHADRESARDPALVLAALPYLTARFRSRTCGPVRSRVGYILDVLRNPARYGFTFVHGRWLTPKRGRRRRKAVPVESIEERRVRVAARSAGDIPGRARLREFLASAGNDHGARLKPTVTIS